MATTFVVLEKEEEHMFYIFLNEQVFWLEYGDLAMVEHGRNRSWEAMIVAMKNGTQLRIWKIVSCVWNKSFLIRAIRIIRLVQLTDLPTQPIFCLPFL